jgi:phage shock protein E
MLDSPLNLSEFEKVILKERNRRLFMSNVQLTLQEFHEQHLQLGKNDVILDVRNPDEFKEAHIKGALNFPLPEVAQHAEELKKYDHVFIHCKRGGRAKSAFDILAGSGLNNLVCISDAGMDMWIEKGFPYVQS